MSSNPQNAVVHVPIENWHILNNDRNSRIFSLTNCLTYLVELEQGDHLSVTTEAAAHLQLL